MRLNLYKTSFGAISFFWKMQKLLCLAKLWLVLSVSLVSAGFGVIHLESFLGRKNEKWWEVNQITDADANLKNALNHFCDTVF